MPIDKRDSFVKVTPMKEISIHSLIDSTAKIKAESEKNQRQIDYIDSRVAPIARFDTPVCIKNKPAFHVDGASVKKVEDVLDQKTIVINGTFRRAEEWKPTPWTAEERAAYWAHRKAESERVNAQTSAVISAMREREKLRKEFLGK